MARLQATVTRDAESGVAYLSLVEDRHGMIESSEHVELSTGPGLVLDLDGEGRLLGIEFLSDCHLPPSVLPADEESDAAR